MIWGGGKKKKKGEARWYSHDLVLLTSLRLVSHLVTSVQSGGLQHRSSPLFVRKQTMNWISKKRYQSPVCIVNNILQHAWMSYTCASDLPLCDSKELFFPIYSQPLSLQLPCSNLALSPQSPAIPRRIDSLSSGTAITAPIALKQKKFGVGY